MKTVLITGTNRGLGLELVKQFTSSGHRVIATCRNASKSLELLNLEKISNGTLELMELDLMSDDSIDGLTALLSDREVDIFINNAGIMGLRGLEFGQITGESWLEVFRINTIAPLLVCQKIIKNINLGRDKKMFFISSRVGSIQENTGGAMYAYRSSKTALNQVVKSLSIDLLDRGISAIALHPGWVLTDMGGPNALIDASTSVSGLIEVMDQVSIKDTGNFFNYDGSMIPW